MSAALSKATLGLGIAAVVSCIFAVAPWLGESFNLIHVSGASIGVLGVLGVLAIIGGARKLPLLGAVAGFGFLVSALLQLVQLGQPLNVVGGDGSTMSLLGGLGIGLVCVWLASRSSTDRSKG